MHIKNFLWLYVDVGSDGQKHPANPVGGQWIQATNQATRNAHAGKKCRDYLSCYLQCWSKAYIKDCTALPHQAPWQTALHIDNEELAGELKLHLQSVGKNGTSTMHILALRICKLHLLYQAGKSLFGFMMNQPSMQMIATHSAGVHISEGAVPQPKGEGASLMVADFISADYGWLCSPDSKETGKACNGYFANENIVAHAKKAMDILEKYYPHEDHILIFDNATTHLKHVDNALSAWKLPKGPSET
ncbi:hypothetical protein BDR07DRAFT_1372976 [Suillus spraguei]|nr:hypothetical protein BDR07DRAFT_1372976 [Suillus spraguei]